MPRKKSLLGQRLRRSAPVPTRQLKLFSTDSSPTRSTSVRPSRNTEKKTRATSVRGSGRAMRHLSLESEVRLPFRRSRSAFATPETPVWQEQHAMSTQQRRRQLCTPMSSTGSIQPWLSTTKKVGKLKKPQDEKYELAAMVVKIQDYFARNDWCNNLIPMSGLQQRIMTLNLFVNLVSHLLGVCYPRHGITMSNYTDKIPQMVKNLDYSGSVMKSWLRTANNAHSWPHVIKLLSWLVSLAEMKDKVVTEAFSSLEEEQDDSPVSDKELLDYYLNTYIAWDQEQMDDIECFTSQLEEKFNTGLCSDEELKALSDEIEQVKKSLVDPQEAEEEARFQQIKAEHDEMQEDFMKLLSEISTQEEGFNNLQQQLFDLSVRKEQLERELQEKHKQLMQKQMLVSTQKVSIEEKLLMDEKKSSLQVDINNLEAIGRKHIDDICSEDMKISQLLRNVCNEKEKFYRKLKEFDNQNVQELLQNKSVTQKEICQVVNDLTSKSKQKTLAMKEKLPGMKSQLEEMKQRLKNSTEKLEKQRARVGSLRINIEKLEENYRQREAEFMFESQQTQNKLKRLKSTAHLVELEEGRSKLETEAKELEELREFRANNGRVGLEVMTKIYADFEKFRKVIAEEDNIRRVLENISTVPSP